MILSLEQTWAGQVLAQAHAGIELRRAGGALQISGWARNVGGPAVHAKPGRVDNLWEHEVLELFLLGEDGHYLELEFGPGGHWLALRLHGVRRVVDDALALDPPPRFGRHADGWTVELTLRDALLPPGCSRVNAFAIVGEGEARRHYAWRGPSPATTAAPDFHRLELFGELSDALRVPGDPASDSVSRD